MKINITLSVLTAVAPFAFFGNQANADTITWDAVNAVSTDWNDGNNWVNGIAPVAGDDVVLIADGTNDPTNNSAYTGISLNSITLDTTSTATLTLGSDIQVGAGGVSNNRVGSLSLNLKGVNLTADSTWGGTRTIFVSGAITGSKMIFDGSGIRFDNNSPSWSSGVDVHTGLGMNDRSADVGATITPWGTGTINLINQRLDGLTNSNVSLSLAVPAGNVDLATATTLANDIVLQDPGTGTYTITQGNDSQTLVGGHFIKLTGTISGAVDSARTLSFNNIKGASAPITFILEGANTHTATTMLNDDYVTLALGNVDALQNSTLDTVASDATKAVTFTVAGTNTYNLGGLKGADDLNIGANTISVGGNDESNSFSGAISGAGGFTKVGTGTQTVAVANSYDGTTTASSGVLAISDALALGSTTGGTTVSDGAALELSGGITVGAEALGLTGSGISDGGALRNTSGDNAYNGAITFNGSTRINSDSGTLTLGGGATGAQAVTFGGAGDITTTGDLAIGAGTITKDGAGRLTLGAANTFSGGTTFAGNALTVGAAGALGTGTVTGTGNAILTFNTASAAAFDNDITLDTAGNNGLFNAGTGDITLNGTVALNNGFTSLVGTGVNNAGFVLGGTINPNQRFGLRDTNLTITGSGDINYVAFRRFTLAESGGSGSALYLEDGVTFNDRIYDSNNNAVTAGKTFILGMKSAGTATFAGDGGLAVDLAVNGGSVANDWEITAVAGATANFTGRIQSNQAVGSTITKTGAGTVVFSAANTYDGSTTVAEGKLTIASSGTINGTSEVFIGAGEFNYNSSSTLTQDVSFLSTGGILSGTGTMGNAINITTGNTLAIGNSVGTMDFVSNLTVTGTYEFELNGGTSSADLGNVGGDLTLGGILDLVQLGSYNVGDKFTLLSYFGTLSGEFTDGSLVTLADDTTFTAAGGIWQINYNDTVAGNNTGELYSNFVTVTAVPEPSAFALLCLGVLGFCARRRR
ncbi:MAG: autotransporter-associated beta strand repeat-containing protein [Akkermansiaceae bacterium]|nr:autotransporter-associated beta strand repeat-containing protein [Akkermansiaceae bacterium]MDP4780068.1 autotransporter-associated beta strand repeat-containing protein [Akkermansiaceae bacterium]MDP4847661.1 autotransporter-associated beta strand repeat-containing protein [Akkermansiaceae bacterium]